MKLATLLIITLAATSAQARANHGGHFEFNPIATMGERARCGDHPMILDVLDDGGTNVRFITSDMYHDDWTHCRAQAKGVYTCDGATASEPYAGKYGITVHVQLNADGTINGYTRQADCTWPMQRGHDSSTAHMSQKQLDHEISCGIFQDLGKAQFLKLIEKDKIAHPDRVKHLQSLISCFK